MIRLIGLILIFATSNLAAEPPTGADATYKVEKMQHQDGDKGYLVKNVSGEELGIYQAVADDKVDEWVVDEQMPLLKIHVILPDSKKSWSGGAINSDCHE